MTETGSSIITGAMATALAFFSLITAQFKGEATFVERDDETHVPVIRACDRLCGESIVALPAVMIGLGCALAVRLTSRGPVLFRQALTRLE